VQLRVARERAQNAKLISFFTAERAGEDSFSKLPFRKQFPCLVRSIPTARMSYAVDLL
jgi:hypothetical protein